MPIDADRFEDFRHQDEVRGRLLQSKEKFDNEVREHLMFLESYVNYYSEASSKRHNSLKIREMMNDRYHALIQMLRNAFSNDSFFSLVKEDRQDTLQSLVKYFGRKGLPRPLDDQYYQSLHPKTKKDWGIRRTEDHTKS
jgi:hypothetical protein